MKIRRNLAVLAVSTLLAIYAGVAQADPWTFTTTGTIGFGIDASGIFFGGTPTYDLAGLSYIQTTIVDPNSYAFQVTSDVAHYGDSGNVSFSEIITINGVTKTFSGIAENGESVLSNGGDQGGYEAFQYDQGITVDGFDIESDQFSHGPGPVNLGLSYSQVWSYNPVVTDSTMSGFFVDGLDGQLMFTAGTTSYPAHGGSVDTISINIDPANIPEPATLFLAVLGLLSLVAARRKIHQKR